MQSGGVRRKSASLKGAGFDLATTALELRRDWIDLREIVDRVASAARRRGAPHKIEVA